jgi:hypothetical protein
LSGWLVRGADQALTFERFDVAVHADRDVSSHSIRVHARHRFRLDYANDREPLISERDSQHSVPLMG